MRPPRSCPVCSRKSAKFAMLFVLVSGSLGAAHIRAGMTFSSGRLAESTQRSQPVRIARVLGVASDATRFVSFRVAPQEDEIEQRVHELADDSFSVREAATQRLIEIGLPAIPLLQKVQSHPDRELRYRASRILATVQQGDLGRRIEAFQAGLRKADGSLPGWSRFVGIVGDRPETRRFFVELYKSDYGLLLLEPHESAERQAAFRKLLGQVQMATEDPQQQVAVERIASLLFWAADARLECSHLDWIGLYYLVGNAGFRQAMEQPASGKILRQLLVPWLARASSQEFYQALDISLRYDVPWGLGLATEVLQQPHEYSTQVLPLAIDAVAKFGDVSHLDLLVPLVDSEMRLAARAEGDATVVTHLGDLALAAAIHLTGQSPKDFGFSRVVYHDEHVFVHSSLGFADELARQQARNSWLQQQSQR